MSISVNVTDPQTSDTARVTTYGALVTASAKFDESSFQAMDLDNTAYNFYVPKFGQQFVITGMIVKGDKQVASNTNATVIVYEATSVDTTTADKVIVQFEVGQNESIPVPRLNFLVSKSRWVNAKTDDDDIHMTILGYYVDST